jgi:uncharacterized protein YjbJ (UPF0337 family)
MANEQQAEGKMEQARGTVKENVGDAVGNDRMQQEGAWDKAKGDVREGVGKAREDMDHAVDDLKHDH